MPLPEANPYAAPRSDVAEPSRSTKGFRIFFFAIGGLLFLRFQEVSSVLMGEAGILTAVFALIAVAAGALLIATGVLAGERNPSVTRFGRAALILYLVNVTASTVRLGSEWMSADSPLLRSQAIGGVIGTLMAFAVAYVIHRGTQRFAAAARPQS